MSYYERMLELPDRIKALEATSALVESLRVENSRLHLHIKKLKSLILLTDPAVETAPMNDLSATQWRAYLEFLESL